MVTSSREPGGRELFGVRPRWHTTGSNGARSICGFRSPHPGGDPRRSKLAAVARTDLDRHRRLEIVFSGAA
jgi:hypothetical protein